jgi:hypothetical protein
MTFKIGIPLILFTLGCSAPEVKPPEPSPSPRDLAGMGISSAQASPVQKPEERSEENEVTSNKEDFSSVQEDNNTPDAQEDDGNVVTDTTPNTDKEGPINLQFPFSAWTKSANISLQGPGGRDIAIIPRQFARVKVLGEKGEHYRIICLGCNNKRPFQAGFIEKENLLTRANTIPLLDLILKIRKDWSKGKNLPVGFTSNSLCTILDQGFILEKDILQWQLEDSYIQLRSNEDNWSLDTVHRGALPYANVTGCNLP